MVAASVLVAGVLGGAAGGAAAQCIASRWKKLQTLLPQGRGALTWPPDVRALKRKWPAPPAEGDEVEKARTGSGFGGRNRTSSGFASSDGGDGPEVSSDTVPVPPGVLPVPVPVPVPTLSSSGSFYALRLKPGEELKNSLLRFIQDNAISAASVVTCVGSLTSATLRMANADRDHPNEIRRYSERFEICSLVGTLEAGTSKASSHLHISLSDKEGRVVGGHVVGDCSVFTTAEIVLVTLPDLAFRREADDATGFPELLVCGCSPEEGATRTGGFIRAADLRAVRSGQGLK